jgi:transposase
MMATITEIAELSKKLEEAIAIIASQTAVIAAQEATIQRLETALGLKNVPKNSKNSHQSPSSDLHRKNQSLREKSEKPVGGQMGHPGHTLEMTDTPDRIETVRPAYCNRCGASLSESVGE